MRKLNGELNRSQFRVSLQTSIIIYHIVARIGFKNDKKILEKIRRKSIKKTIQCFNHIDS